MHGNLDIKLERLSVEKED